MDKHHDDTERKTVSNRPRWLTLGMMATAASVLFLAGCGDNEETAPPADEAATLEQDATSQPEPSMTEEPAMEQDPGLGDEPAMEGSMSQPEEGAMSEGSMPDNTMDEPAEGAMNPDQDEPGFGEGTDPMPGTEDEQNSTVN